jgi:putative nucleotidyltransferase with HDIG domain
LITRQVSKRNVIYHMFAVEAIMRSAARYLDQNEDVWGMLGLLHDVDYEKTETTPEKHGLLGEEILSGKISDELIRAIKAHNSIHTGVKPETMMEKALIACDAISGLLVACALVMPSKKLADVKTETVAKKFKDKDFARGAERERIMVCEEIGIPKERFFEVSLIGLRVVASQVGL